MEAMLLNFARSSVPASSTPGHDRGGVAENASHVAAVGDPTSPAAAGGLSDPDGLRGYQRACVESVRAELAKDEVRATLAVLFTGAGKTQIAGCLAKHWPGRVLWLAHRDELLDQARKRIQAMTGEWVSLEQAGLRATGTRIVVGSVQTLRGKRLAGHDPAKFSLVIVDEAHHAPSKSYRNILKHFAGAKIFGITATADRLDKLAMGSVFDSAAFVKGIDEGIDEGYLTPIVPVAKLIDSVDLGKLRARGGDLELDALEEEMLKSVAALARATFDTVGDRRTLIFTPGVGSAHGVAAALNALRPGCARTIDGTTDADERRLTLAAHRNGEFQFLTNCLVLTEGYDDPSVAAVVMARPTTSRALYVQVAGRGLRVLPGIGELPDLADRLSAIAASAKPNCMLVDITGRAGEHSLISAVNLFDGKYPVDEQERAGELMEQEPSLTLLDALKKAREILSEEREEEKRQEEIRRRAAAEAAARSKVAHRSVAFDPFASFRIADPAEDAWAPSWHSEEASAAQVAWCEKNGLPMMGLTKGQVSKLMDTAKVWRERNLANFKQRKQLKKFGLPENCYFETASLLLEAVARNGWHRPPQDVIDGVLQRAREMRGDRKAS
jgi:superfamily II DNA or RNA helicase